MPIRTPKGEFMTRRTLIARALLWLFVILMGIELGAGLYESRVVVPLWAGAPPESVWELSDLMRSHPQYMMNAGLRFWRFTTPPLGLLAVANLVAGWGDRGGHRKWLLASAAAVIVLVAVTFIYFVPALGELFESRRLGLSGEEVARGARLWATLNWARAAVYLLAWLAALRALTTYHRGEAGV